MSQAHLCCAHAVAPVYKPLLAFLAGKRQLWGLSTSNTFFPFLNHGAIRVATCRANPGCLFGELL